MKRRNLIALVAAGMLVTIALLMVGSILVITRTRRGQDFVRGQVAERIAPLARGRPPYIGHIDLSSFLTRLTVDSVALYDANGDVFFSCGRFEAGYDWRDIPDSRIALHTVNVEHPYLHLRQHANESWNFSELFRSSPPSRGPKPAGFSWGDYVTLDSVRVHDATFILSMPWRPDDTLHGTAIDSAIRRELLRTDHIIRRTADGFERIRTWNHATIFVPYLRLADPDSDRRSGKVAEVGDLRVEESDPPFIFRHLAGMVRLHDDSLLLSVSHFDLPASTGEAQGTVVWGGEKPPRYDLHIHADSVALNDMNWVYPALPRTGGGKTLLTIRNERDLRIVDYRLDSMDLRSTKSHLTGSMTFGAGAPVLIVRDVNVVADPIDFDFIRTLNGKDFPIDWRGQIFGTARGPGGPVTEFVLDDTQAEWRDTHVPGAVSQFGGHGELNILDPAVTAFHNFQLTVGSLDLRSIEYLFPAFPRLKGTVSGTAMLDSSWEDVRFHDADLTHRDGPGDESHFSGKGRVTIGEPITYDVSLNAQPISFDLLARTYPNWVLHGTLNGPIRVVGQTPDLDVKTTLRGTPGAFSFDGRVDLDSASGYKVNGQGELVDLDLPKISGDRIPFPGKASGHYDVDLTDLFVNTKLAGVAAVDLESSVIDHTPVSKAHARASFSAGVAHLLDGLEANGPGWSATATGGIGLPTLAGATDSLRVVFETDSLTQWRPYLTSYVSPSVLDSLSSDRDSLEVTVSGRIDSTFALHDGRAWAQRVALGIDTNPLFSARNASATFGIESTLSAPHGQFAFWADTLRAATLDLDTLSGTWQLVDRTHSRFTFAVAHAPGLTAQLGGTATFSGATQAWRFDQGFVTPDSASRWQLDSTPALISLTGASIDSLAFGLTNGKGGHVSAVGSLPDSAPVSLDVSATGVAPHDLTDVAEHPLDLRGNADFAAHIRGTRANPEIAYRATLSQPVYADVHLAALTVRGAYVNDRLFDTVTVSRDSTADASADVSIPLKLSLLPFAVQLFQDSAVSGQLQGGTIDLGFLQPFFPDVKASGTVGAQSLRLQGTLRQPLLIGGVSVHNARVQVAALGAVVFDSVNAHIRLTDNQILIDSLRAHSGASRGDQAELNGSIDMLAGRTGWSQLLYPSAFNLWLSANAFAAYNNPRVATVNIQTTTGQDARARISQGPPKSTGIHLLGPLETATLTGNMIVQNSELYLPDPKLASKQINISIDSVASNASASSQPTWLNRVIKGLSLQNDTVTLGDNVRLKSLPDDPTQADVPLTGTLNVLPAVASASGSADLSARSLSERLALQGTLQAAQGGRYTLDLGIVRRTFTVVSGSTISYDGTAQNIPTLDIKAEYVSSIAGRPDITIIAGVHGPLAADSVTLSSPNAGAGAAQSDLISYLLIGQPGFDFGTNPSVSAALAALFGPTLNVFLTSQFGHIGGGLSNVTFTGASSDVTRTFDPRNDPLHYVTGGRLNSEFQLKSNVYFTIGSGLCVLAGTPQGQNALDVFSQGLAAQLEYRFNPMTHVQFGAEPSTQAQLCSPSFTNLPGLAPTPRQFSLALSHIWRW